MPTSQSFVHRFVQNREYTLDGLTSHSLSVIIKAQRNIRMLVMRLLKNAAFRTALYHTTLKGRIPTHERISHTEIEDEYEELKKDLIAVCLSCPLSDCQDNCRRYNKAKRLLKRKYSLTENIHNE